MKKQKTVTVDNVSHMIKVRSHANTYEYARMVADRSVVNADVISSGFDIINGLSSVVNVDSVCSGTMRVYDFSVKDNLRHVIASPKLGTTLRVVMFFTDESCKRDQLIWKLEQPSTGIKIDKVLDLDERDNCVTVEEPYCKMPFEYLNVNSFPINKKGYKSINQAKPTKKCFVVFDLELNRAAKLSMKMKTVETIKATLEDPKKHEMMRANLQKALKNQTMLTQICETVKTATNTAKDTSDPTDATSTNQNDPSHPTETPSNPSETPSNPPSNPTTDAGGVDKDFIKILLTEAKKWNLSDDKKSTISDIMRVMMGGANPETLTDIVEDTEYVETGNGSATVDF